MQVLNNKIHLRLLPEDQQPQRSLFQPTADLLKYAEVLGVGSKVTEIQKGQKIVVYVNALRMLNDKEGFCTERDPVFVDDLPRQGKVNTTKAAKEILTGFDKAEVLSSSSEGIEPGDTVYYTAGQSHILPDNTELISDSQIYFKG